MARRKKSAAANAASSSPVAPSFARASAPPWIYTPWLDLLVGCGGWSAPLLLVALVANRAETQQWALAFYFLALLFNYPHFMATVYRAYHTHEQFEKYRIFTLHVALLLILAGVLAHTVPAFLPWLFTLYICWSPWHYTGQNFGLLMMFARRAGLAPELRERRALYAAFWASYVLLMLSFHTGPSHDEMILSLGIPPDWALWPEAACGIFFVGIGGWALARLVRRGADWRAWAGPATLFISQFLWFVLPVGLEVTSGLQVPQVRYSSGMLAVLHSTQYIWITSYYQRREARAEGRADWHFSAYAATLVAGGIALFIPGPWIVSRAFHVDFGASFLTFTALVNIHHFILDGAVWKLRDARVSALLVDHAEQPAAASASDVRGRALAAARWLAGDSGGARAVRITAAVLLIAWGLMDQARFYWASAEGRLPELERAARLDPYDSGLLARIARADQDAKNSPAAIDALTRALQLRPRARGLQAALAHELLLAGQYQEAFQRYQKLLEQYPNDVDALVNAGVLAQRLGRPAEAVDDWNRAITLDPSQAKAQLYLGDALSARGEEQAAARHYRAYLQLVTQHPERYSSDSHQELGAIIKVADAFARARQPAEAAIGYEAAVPLAEKEHDVAMESLALVHHAELAEAMGIHAQAAQFYQQALQADAAYNDAPSVASDWVEYGQFLRRRGQPERLVFACLLHAEQLIQAEPGSEHDAITKVREDSEARLGATAAAAVRRQPDVVLQEAASVSPRELTH